MVVKYCGWIFCGMNTLEGLINLFHGQYAKAMDSYVVAFWSGMAAYYYRSGN